MGTFKLTLWLLLCGLTGCSGGDANSGGSFDSAEGTPIETGTMYTVEGAGFVVLSESATSMVQLRALPNAHFSDAGALLSDPMGVRLSESRDTALPFKMNLLATNALQGEGIAIVIKQGDEDGGVVVPTAYVSAFLEGEDERRECVGTAAGSGLDCKPIWTFSVVTDYTDAAWAVINLPSAGRYPRGYEPLKIADEVTNLGLEREGGALTVSWTSAPDLDTLVAYRPGDTPPPTCGENRVVRVPHGESRITLDVAEQMDVSVRVCSFFTGLPVSRGITASSAN